MANHTINLTPGQEKGCNWAANKQGLTKDEFLQQLVTAQCEVYLRQKRKEKSLTAINNYLDTGNWDTSINDD